MSAIEIVEYDPNWPALFEKEKTRLLSVAGSYIDDIQHMGSTSVPGLAAKPIVDMMVGLSTIALVEKCISPFQSLNYEYLGENGIPERHFFRNPPGQSWVGRLYNLHVVQKGGYEWQKNITFRDYLRTHPEETHQYYLLKKELAAQYSSDPLAYINYPAAKTAFITLILAKAGFTVSGKEQ